MQHGPFRPMACLVRFLAAFALCGLFTADADATGLIPALQMPNVPVIKNNAPGISPSPNVGDISVEIALSEGQKDLSGGKDREALQVFKGIFLDTPRDRIPLPVYLGISRVYRHLKAPDKSIVTLLPLLKSQILAQANPAGKQEYMYELGVSDALMHNNTGIEHFLVPVFPRLEKPREILTAAHALLPYFESVNPVEGTVFLGRAIDRIDPVHQQEMLSSIIELIHDHISDKAELESIRRTFPHEFPGDYAQFRTGLLALADKNPEKAEFLFLSLLANYPASLFTGSAEERLNHLSLPSDMPVLAVILPLLSDRTRGPYAHSFLLGLRDFFRNRPSSGTSFPALMLRFAKTSRTYLRTLKSLVDHQKVVALLGPFFADDYEVSSRFLERSDLIAVSPTLPPDKNVSGFFSTATLPDMMASAAAIVTEKKVSPPHAVVVFPKGPYGRHVKKVYEESLTGLGGQVIGSIAYDPRRSDNQAAIGELKKFGKIQEISKNTGLPDGATLVSDDALQLDGKVFYLGTRNIGSQHIRTLFIPAFNVLYVPDTSYEPASLLREIAYKNIQNVLLIGNETFLRIRGLSGISELHDTVLATGPPPPAPSSPVRLRAFGKGRPSLFTLQTYDALRLLEKASASEEGPTGQAIRKYLESHPSLRGLSGTMTWNGPGQFQKTVTVYQLSGRRWIPSDTVEVTYGNEKQ
ncbi:MAG: ABC transporter substrate-binding protein [Nitrospirae bacterium]|nr:ABC transporter substrate-binding protein [Nitrospirota bacterium]